HGRWSHAPVHRFRTAPDLNRPPGLVVAGRQIHLRGSRRDRRGHRVTRRIAAMNPEKADTEQASLVPDDKGSEMKVARVFFYRIFFSCRSRLQNGLELAKITNLPVLYIPDEVPLNIVVP